MLFIFCCGEERKKVNELLRTICLLFWLLLNISYKNLYNFRQLLDYNDHKSSFSGLKKSQQTIVKFVSYFRRITTKRLVRHMITLKCKLSFYLYFLLLAQHEAGEKRKERNVNYD